MSILVKPGCVTQSIGSHLSIVGVSRGPTCIMAMGMEWSAEEIQCEEQDKNTADNALPRADARACLSILHGCAHCIEATELMD